MELPKQLQNPAFRFIPLGKWNEITDKNTNTLVTLKAGEYTKEKYKGYQIWGKSPCIKSNNQYNLISNWKNKGFVYTHKNMEICFNNQYNVGIIASYGNIRYIDVDNVKPYQIDIINKLNTFVVKTGSGGFHIYFYTKDNGTSKMNDVEYTHGQILIPGCTHPNGNKYIVYKDLPIDEFNTETINILLFNLRGDIDEKLDVSRSGADFSLMIKKFYEGKSYEQVEKEIKVETIKWKEEGPGYLKLSLTNAQNFVLKNPKKEIVEETEKFISWEQIKNTNYPEVEWIVENIIQKQGITLFAGDGYSFKSFLAMHLALCCDSGQKFMNTFNVQKCKVMYIDEEQGIRSLKTRIIKLIKGQNITEPINIVGSCLEGITIDMQENDKFLLLKHAIDKHKPSLVIIDSLSRILTGDENNVKDVRALLGNLKIFLKQDITFVIIHHNRKNKTEGNKVALRGSTDIYNAVHGCYNIQEVVEREKYQFEELKSRDGPRHKRLMTFRVEDQDDGGIKIELERSMDIDEFSGRKTQVDKGIPILREWINNRADDKFTTKESDAYLLTQGINETSAKTIRNYLITTGLIKHDTKGVWIINKEETFHLNDIS